MTSLPVPFDDIEYRVVGRVLATPAIVDLRLQPLRAPIPMWRPGQYVQLGDIDHGVPIRSYSIGNAAREDGEVRLLVTRVPGGVMSAWAHDVLRAGTNVLLSGPYGMFAAGLAANETDPVLCLAGGSGIAPMLALAEDAVRRRVPQPFSVLFSARTAADVIDEQRWRAWSRQYPHLRFDRTLTRQAGEPPTGRIPGILHQVHPDLTRCQVCIAGDPAFVRDCARTARALGAPPGCLHTEEFFAEPQPWFAAEPEVRR